MTRAPRMRAAVVASAALGVLAAVLAVRELSGGDQSLVHSDGPATIDCAGSVVELEFDPDAGVDARARGTTVASADVSRRGLNHTDCRETPAHRGWDTRLRYEVVGERVTITCRFPGRFLVQANSVSPSWAGERPAGSAVGLVLGRRVGPGSGPDRTLVATATVLERAGESQLIYAPRFCMVS